MTKANERLWASPLRVVCERYECAGAEVFGGIIRAGEYNGTFTTAIGERFERLLSFEMQEMSSLGRLVICEGAHIHWDAEKQCLVNREGKCA